MEIVCNNYTLKFENDIIGISPGECFIPLNTIQDMMIIEPEEFIQGTLQIKLKDMFNGNKNSLFFSFDGDANYQKAISIFERFESEKINYFLNDLKEDENTEEADNIGVEVLTQDEIDELLELISKENSDDDNWEDELTSLTDTTVTSDDNNVDLIKHEFTFTDIKCLKHILKLDERYLYIEPGELRIFILNIDHISVVEPDLLTQGLISINIKDGAVSPNKLLLFAFDDKELYYEAIKLRDYIDNLDNDYINEIYNYRIKHSEDMELELEFLEEFNASLEELTKNLDRILYWNNRSVEFSDFIDVYNFDNIEDYQSYVNEIKKLNCMKYDNTGD